MELSEKATIEDLYDFIAEKPCKSTEMIDYLGKGIEKKGLGSVSRSITYRWLSMLVAGKRVEVMPPRDGWPRKYTYYHVIDTSSVTKKDQVKYGRKSIDTKSIHTLSMREIKFTTIKDANPHEIELLIHAMGDRLSGGYRVRALVLEYYDGGYTIYYKHAGLFFKDDVLEQVCLSRSLCMVALAGPSYEGSGKQAYDRIRSFLGEHKEITVKIDRDSLKTYEEFCETEKDEEAVMDYLEKQGYLS